MKVLKRQYNRSQLREGSALIMVIVLTVLLSLIGALFMMMSRIDEMSTSSIKADTELQLAVDAVVDQVNKVLVEDIFSDTTPQWLDGNGTNEPWDYPGDDDIWLANLEPELVDVEIDGATVDIDQPGFRHITDLYGRFEDMFAAATLDGSDDLVSAWNLRATIIDPAADIAEGQKADADGDGVADSRWTKIPDIFSKDGKPIYTAVRIIDNAAMININTAYRDPTNLTTPGDWDGSRLSHVNLEGITDPDPGSRLDAALVQAMRYGTVTTTIGAGDFLDYINDMEYEDHVARRLKDPFVVGPAEMYLPFDISDELELRNRFFLSTSYKRNGVATRLGETWPSKFNPQADPGKGIPYNNTTDLPFWYDKVGPNGIGFSNRRHYSTTYNFDTIERPYDVTNYPFYMRTITTLSDSRKFGVTLPLEIQQDQSSTVVKENYIRRLAMAIYRGLSEDTVIKARFGPDYTSEKLACQMAVNMVDYQDDKWDLSVSPSVDAEEEVTKITIGNETYFGVEDFETLNRDTLCISKIGYVNITAGAIPPGKYFAIEVYNPDEIEGKDSTAMLDYEIRITDSNGNYKGKVGSLSGSLNPAGAASGNTAAFAFTSLTNNISDAITALSAPAITAIIPATPANLTLEDGDKLALVKISTSMPVDLVTVPAGTTAVPDDTLWVRFRRMRIADTNLLLPTWSSADTADIILLWRYSMSLGTTDHPRLGDYLDPADLEDPTDPDLAGLEKVQLNAPNHQLRNLAEIENIFAVGASFHEVTGVNKYSCNTLITNIVESVVAIKQLSLIADLTADQQDSIEMGSFGRIRLDDPDYWPMLESFTYFDPARDGVDLINIAEGITPMVTAGIVDVLSAPLDTLTDGLFLPRTTLWTDQTVYWNGTTVEIEIDLGTAKQIFGAIIQADNNDGPGVGDEYVLEYYDGAAWYPLWFLEDYDDVDVPVPGMHTRPDMYDDARWHLFDTPVIASKVRVKAIAGDDEYSLSEIQIGVKYDPAADDPYYYDNTVPGRININTAPWYVINQLPWIEDAFATEPGSLAQAIVAFRDKAETPLGLVDYSGPTGRFDATNIAAVTEEPSFTDIAQLLQVTNTDPATVDYDIRKCMYDEDSVGDPVNTGSISGMIDYSLDNVTDDFEERNLLFHRISNLVTLRSDVFTAYILVRIGENGPQRRMIAIFDRSAINSSSDKPKLVALHRVPDPR